MARYLDDAAIEAFRRDGFVRAGGLLSREEVVRFGDIVSAAVRARKSADTRTLEEKSAYEQSFLQCQYLWEDFAAVRPLTFHERVAGAAAELIGAAGVRLWHDQALYKEAGGRETDPHQDHAYWPIVETDTLTAWIPFQAVNEESGAMGYVPGSHMIGSLEYADIFRAPGKTDILDTAYVKAHPPVFLSAEPGDVLFHHGRTIHMAKPNASARDRCVYTAIYFRDGCTRAAKGEHPSLQRAGIAVGAKIESPVTPLAWPLAEGAYPEPVAWPAPQSEMMRRASRLGVFPAALR